MLKRIALISDIQGNFVALDTVLARIDTEVVDKVICLGDVASGPQPHQVLASLQEREIDVVRGNMDDTILNPQRHDSDELDILRYDDIDQWCHEQLETDDRHYMRQFPHLLRYDLEGAKQLLCFHGSPDSYNDVIDETLTEEQLSLHINGYIDDVMATGHMHHPFLRDFDNTLIVNPGSVGLPRKQNGKHPLQAHYAILDMIDSKINIQFRTVPISPTRLEESILNSGMPHAEWFLAQWAIERT
jgi:putative phosphoesterase